MVSDGITFDVARSDSGIASAPAEDSNDCLTVGLGLHVISTQFNQHPRVAMQLRGRSGRQGGFGSSRFLLSLEDQQLFPAGTNIRHLDDCATRDPANYSCWQGPAVERYLREQEQWAEIEAETARGWVNDFSAVSDLHVAAYYRLRQEWLGARGVLDDLPGIAQEAAEALVARHFPALETSQYPARFAGFREEASRRFGIDISDLYGVSLFRSAHFDDRPHGPEVAVHSGRHGRRGLYEAARSLLLECTDEAWRSHQAHLQATILTSMTSFHGHKAAVADYIIGADGLWDEFRASCWDAFLVRLLNLSEQWHLKESKERRIEPGDEEELLRLIA